MLNQTRGRLGTFCSSFRLVWQLGSRMTQMGPSGTLEKTTVRIAVMGYTLCMWSDCVWCAAWIGMCQCQSICSLANVTISMWHVA